MEAEVPELSKSQKKGVMGQIVMWITIITFGAASLGPYVAPEKFATKKEEAVIHEDVEHLKEDIRKDLLVEFNEKIATSSKEHRQFKSKIYNLEQEILILTKDVESLQTINEGFSKQILFLTHSLSNTDEAIIELMIKKEECSWTYYETNRGDNWYLFEDWYACKTLQRVTLLSDCRAKITPFDRNTIQVR